MASRKTLGEYTWVSAAQYIQWLELNCQLQAVEISAIWSMRVTPKTGFRGLLSRKIKLENVLKDNRDKLESFTLETRELELEEVDVIAAFVGNIDSALIAIREQIHTLERVALWDQEGLSIDVRDVENLGTEVPF